jgi:hypothetical protein
VAAGDLIGTKGFQLLHSRGVLASTEIVVWFPIGSINLNASNNTDIFLQSYETVWARRVWYAPMGSWGEVSEGHSEEEERAKRLASI